MEPTTQKEFPRAVITNVYEKQVCSKKIIVRMKVSPIKNPPPRRLTVEIIFNDGTARTAEAVLVSAYSNYAYYDLAATDAREVYPRANEIREVRVIGE
jgi:hypothetical protein